MDGYYSYENGVVISKSKIQKVSAGFMELIKEELPEEALSVTVLDSVLEDIKSQIHSARLRL